jgi:copper chaperone CopZ
MLARLYRLIHYRADELLVTAAVLVGASLYYVPGLMPLLSSEGFQAKHAQSTEVREDIRANFVKDEPAMLVLIKHKQGLSVDDPKFKVAAQDVITQIKKQDGVETVHSFYDTGQSDFVSKDKQSTFVAVSIRGSMPEQEKIAVKVRDSLNQPDLDLAFAGT